MQRSNTMRTVRLLRVEESDNLRLNESQLSFPFSTTIVDVNSPQFKRFGSIFLSSRPVQRMVSLVAPHCTLTYTLKRRPFEIAEAESLAYLRDRGEAARVAPVLASLRKVNQESPKVQRDTTGSGGASFLASRERRFEACFKPRGEEPGSRHNPNDTAQRAGVNPGEGAERETAAFILDYGGFSGVPATVMVEACSSSSFKGCTIGSFQIFVNDAQDTVGDFSPQLFPVHQVHKIGILDLRLLNMDRNDANILVVKGRKSERDFRLIPIDHGFCLPDRINVAWCDWVWFDWPQTLAPFDEATKEWVAALDVEEDIRILKQFFGIRAECLRIYRCMNMLLKKGVAAGLNLREIASVVVRSTDLEEPSSLEKTIARASELTMIMDSNSRNRSDSERLHRSSSFDGPASADSFGRKQVPESLFYSYVNRLLEDIVAEIVEMKESSSLNDDDVCGGAFSLSTRSSATELTKLASPRLVPANKKKPVLIPPFALQ